MLLDGELDTAMVGMFEQKFEKTRFTRVDADIISRLIQKEDEAKNTLDAVQKDVLEGVFSTQMPKIDKTEFHVETQAMGEASAPVIITQSEYMRRMKDMARIQPGMAFYGEMPDMMNIVLNTDHHLIKDILKDSERLDVVSQLIDLALLQNGLLKGEALNNFVKRSIELI